jgi:hypothetical protein
VFLTQSQDASTDDDLVELRKIDLKIAAVCTWTVINNKLDEKVIACAVWFFSRMHSASQVIVQVIVQPQYGGCMHRVTLLERSAA